MMSKTTRKRGNHANAVLTSERSNADMFESETVASSVSSFWYIIRQSEIACECVILLFMIISKFSVVWFF
jgi:hypothetical protein